MKKGIKLTLLLCLVTAACVLMLTACDITDIFAKDPQETTAETTTLEETTTSEEIYTEKDFFDWYHPVQHIMGEWVIIQEATCEKYGFMERRCTECDWRELIPYEEHFEEDITTDEFFPDGYHPDQHVIGEWVIIQEATSEKDGLMERRCTECDWRELVPYEEHFEVVD